MNAEERFTRVCRSIREISRVTIRVLVVTFFSPVLCLKVLTSSRKLICVYFASVHPCTIGFYNGACCFGELCCRILSLGRVAVTRPSRNRTIIDPALNAIFTYMSALRLRKLALFIKDFGVNTSCTSKQTSESSVRGFDSPYMLT